jgi:hypothetical protein
LFVPKETSIDIKWTDVFASGSRTRVPMSVEGRAPMYFTVDAAAKEFPTAFALSIRKSGSSIFNNIVTAIARASGRTVVDIPATAFENNIPYPLWNDPSNLPGLVWRGNIYVGFRDAPTAIFNDRVFQQATKLLLVRDPRDILVSEFFSNAYSHSLPKKDSNASVVAKERKAALQSDIETYVLGRIEALNDTIRRYQPLLNDERLTVLRYEDVIFEKASWMSQIADAFELDLTERLIKDILGWADVRPETENPTNFIRRVTPGDYLEKLSSEVVARLEDGLDNVWWNLGYMRSKVRLPRSEL